MVHLGDIRRIDGGVAEPVDVVIGGSPCQDLSVAGSQKGFSGERSVLFMDQIRIVREMREADEREGRTDLDVRPRSMVWENVPGAFSSNRGEDFRTVLQEIVRIKDKELSVPRPPKGKWEGAGLTFTLSSLSLRAGQYRFDAGIQFEDGTRQTVIFSDEGVLKVIAKANTDAG